MAGDACQHGRQSRLKILPSRRSRPYPPKQGRFRDRQLAYHLREIERSRIRGFQFERPGRSLRGEYGDGDYSILEKTNPVGFRRLERVLRVRDQHPGQHAGAYGPVAVRAEDAGFACFRPHPARPWPDDVPFDHVLRVALLPARPGNRPRGRLRVAIGRERAAHVYRHFRDNAPDHAQDERSDQGLGGWPGLGVLSELHPNDRWLPRADRTQNHAAGSPPRHALRASPSPSSPCGRRWRCT